jgi:hypothetical protein
MTRDDYLHLLGLQRAEFAKSAHMDRISIALQICITGLAIGGILADSRPVLVYILAISALASSAIWGWLSRQVIKTRTVAESARRAVVLHKGLGTHMSPDEFADLCLRFSVTKKYGKKFEDEHWFASTVPPGPSLFADMIHESAFFSAYLYKKSALFFRWAFSLSLAFAVAALLIGTTYGAPSDRLRAAEIVCTVLTVVISKDMLGRALDYNSAAGKVADIENRIQRLSFPGSEVDLTLIFADYNSTVESAPIIAPFVYEKYKIFLNTIWSDRNLKKTRNDAGLAHTPLPGSSSSEWKI